MNERIFELAKQADLIQWDSLPSGARTPDHKSVVKARKFALLIVRECEEVVRWAISVDSTIEKVPVLIREHFGVEE